MSRLDKDPALYTDGASDDLAYSLRPERLGALRMRSAVLRLSSRSSGLSAQLERGFSEVTPSAVQGHREAVNAEVIVNGRAWTFQVKFPSEWLSDVVRRRGESRHFPGTAVTHPKGLAVRAGCQQQQASVSQNHCAALEDDHASAQPLWNLPDYERTERVVYV